jgi:hypothetical protein
MATEQRTVTVEAVVTNIQIDPVSKTLVLRGVVRYGAGESAVVLERYEEDVTALMDATDVQAALRLFNRSQQWIDSKL